jgi:hypothetical protein
VGLVAVGGRRVLCWCCPEPSLHVYALLLKMPREVSLFHCCMNATSILTKLIPCIVLMSSRAHSAPLLPAALPTSLAAVMNPSPLLCASSRRALVLICRLVGMDFSTIRSFGCAMVSQPEPSDQNSLGLSSDPSGPSRHLFPFPV